MGKSTNNNSGPQRQLRTKGHTQNLDLDSETSVFYIRRTRPHGIGGVLALSHLRDYNLYRKKQQLCTRKWESKEPDVFRRA